MHGCVERDAPVFTNGDKLSFVNFVPLFTLRNKLGVFGPSSPISPSSSLCAWAEFQWSVCMYMLYLLLYKSSCQALSVRAMFCT